MTKILTIVGARPQFIKAAAVSRAIQERSGLQEVLVHTGQHFDAGMSRVFFEQMQIPGPKYQLNIHSLPHGAMTGRMLEALEEVLQAEQPDWMMVYGDTNSTLAGALAASKMHIPVAHVEAGLRSFNMQMPEEVNRIMTDRLSRLLFCPTEKAINNLEAEGFRNFHCRIVRTGDVMYDAALFFRNRAIKPDYENIPDHFVLLTIHREENTRDPHLFADMIRAINLLAEKTDVLFPMHPRTRKLVKDAHLPAFSQKVHVIDPVSYLEMLWLLERTDVVITDSGGMQKEACFFEKPCITLRGETEWVELVDAGYNRLCGRDSTCLLEAYDHFTNNPPNFTGGLYGKGNASAIIAEALSEDIRK